MKDKIMDENRFNFMIGLGYFMMAIFIFVILYFLYPYLHKKYSIFIWRRKAKKYDMPHKFTVKYIDDIINNPLEKTPARISLDKREFSKITTEQRLSILFHEYADMNMQSLSRFETRRDFEAEQKKYFENFPFDEQAVRDFLACKKELGYFKNYDVRTAKLSDMIAYPDYGYGFRIMNVTVGKGTHNTMMYGGHKMLDRNFEVNEDEVYITYNTIQTLSGGKYTSVMKRKDGKNELIKCYTHSRS